MVSRRRNINAGSDVDIAFRVKIMIVPAQRHLRIDCVIKIFGNADFQTPFNMLAKGIADINLLTFYNHMHHNDPILRSETNIRQKTALNSI
eukprot:NODE_14856_length_416_cov_13.657439_g14833_i0.p1 GENE.NODE_14856_length_416_cov_13.657439_g14833_i0~~NODE_14856_length_416_cov_13.657439_g14833_i0.p1  ORF type:complete len:101 (+),score=13.95 NODE_14856_length_416_cov_13.657439_g14833_i0:32-304(+)